MDDTTKTITNTTTVKTMGDTIQVDASTTSDTAVQPQAATPKHKVEIYSTSSCHYCQLAKAYFTAHDVAYVEYNVGTDPVKRAEMVQITGQMGVPVIVIDDSVLVGFNEEALGKLLE